MGAGLIQPLFQCGGVKAGADGGIEKDFPLPQRLKLRLAQEQNILVQTGKDHFALPEQSVQRLILHACGLGVGLMAAAVVGDVRAEEGQCIGDHPARNAQTHDTHL